MNNKFKLFTLSALSCVVLGLTSCDVTEKGNVVIEFKDGKSTTTQSITADEIYSQYGKTQSGAKAYYDAIYNVVIRHLMMNGAPEAKKNELITKAKTQVQGIKDQANNNADSNKTNYSDELEKLLDSNGVETLEELQTKFEDSLFKEYLEDDFYDWAIEYLKDGSVTDQMKEVDAKGAQVLEAAAFDPFDSYLNTLIPYHVKHILVKVSAAAGEYARATISESEATNIANAFKQLSTISATNTFGRIAKSISEDPGSKESEGDLGLMSKNTSYVNEFKLGIYTYDSLFNSETSTNTDEIEKIGLVGSGDADMEQYKNQLETLGLGEIPFGAAVTLNEYAKVTKDDNGNSVNDNSAVTYPRNIIFNQFFNSHTISVITADSVNEYGEVEHDNAYASSTGFQDVTFTINGSPVTKTVLCDENGNPILVTRASSTGGNAYEGIHFIVVQRDPLINSTGDVSLSEYFTTYLPGNTNFPKDESGDEKICYVNYLKSDTSTYLSRSNTLKDEIKATDSNASYKLFNYFFNKSGATFKSDELKDVITRYIASNDVSSNNTKDKNYKDAWKDYTNMLGVQTNNQARKFPVTCAVKYKDANGMYKADFEIGGECYYEE